jgi:hypothetical protein
MTISTTVAEIRKHMARDGFVRLNRPAAGEAQASATCEEAGIEVRYAQGHDEVAAGETVTKTWTRDLGRGRMFAWASEWVTPFLDATEAASIGGNPGHRLNVLRLAARDVQWREAALSTWRLGGVNALQDFINKGSQGTKRARKR